MLCSDCREEGVHPTGFRSTSSAFGFGCLVMCICAGYHAWVPDTWGVLHKAGRTMVGVVV